jgi:hypothetical protein
MANSNLITVKQLKAMFLQAVRDLEDMDETKPISLRALEENDDTSEEQGFLTRLAIDIEPSMDDEQNDVNVDITWAVA